MAQSGDTGVAQAFAQVGALKAELEAHVPARATSLDGAAFTFTGPVADPPQIGGYVLVETPGGPRLGQVRDVALDPADGPDVPIASGPLAGVVTRPRFDRIIGSGTMLEAAPPFHDATFRAAPSDEVGARLSARRPASRLTVGRLAQAPEVVAELDARGFARHGFLCGQSGSGKSYATGLILEQLLLETDLPIVVLDPNSDAARLAELREDADPALAERWRAIAPQIAVRRAGGTGDEALHFRFFDLEPALQQALVGLDPLRDREEYDQLREVLEAQRAGAGFDELGARLRADERLRPLALRIANLGLMDWSVWSREREGGLLDELDARAARCLVVDLGSIPAAGERAVVAAAVLSRLWTRRADRKPVLVVIDEAHNVCPPDPPDPLIALATERAIQIAAEGRKFGLHLLAATQRPLKVHENVVSQCDNLFLMRMNSAGDLARLAELFSFVPPGLLSRATSFTLGQTLVAGKVADHPMVVAAGGRIAQEGGADVPTDWARRGA